MSLLLQLSDPHFGTERPEVAAALQAWCAQQSPDVLVWSGDLTQRARRAQFDAASAFSGRLGIAQVLCIPGNHDIPLFNLPARIFHPYGGYARAFGRAEDVALSLPGLLLVGCNTTRPWRHKHGEVSHSQIARTAHWLRSARSDQLRVMVVHQPVWVATEEDQVNLLRGHEAALRTWAGAGMDVVMSGHIHLPGVQALEVQTPRGMRTVWNVQAGTSLSHRLRGGASNSLNAIRYQADASSERVIERWDFDEVHQVFTCVGRYAM